MHYNKPSRRTPIGLLSASLMTLALLSGCSTQPPTQRAPEGVLVYLEATPEPVLVAPKGGLTNADLAAWLPAWQDALRRSNGDKAAARAALEKP